MLIKEGNMADLHIYKLDEYSWYVAHNLMEFLNWYHKYIDSIDTEEDLECLEIIEPEDGYMLNSENITEEDILLLGDNDEICDNEGNVILKRMCGEIFKRQTFAEVIGDEDPAEPYEIASTEF